MAIARGAGTEIIRSASFEAVSSAEQVLIFGVQHHIYTVLSISAFAVTLATPGNAFTCKLVGYDSKDGTSAQIHYVFYQGMQANQTYVWNDKFSFNGAEPTNFTGPMDDATKQDAIADQAEGGAVVAQKLIVYSAAAGDSFDVLVTYIDQNNAQEKP